jgi:membrane associated rhomboid family serine protease
MGFNDRDYQRENRWNDGPGFQLSAPRTMTMRLVLFTSLIYLAQLLSNNAFSEPFKLQPDWYLRPWQAYQLLTYGFLHSNNVSHILFNMLALFFFGRGVEERYGSKEFLLFYLAAIVVAGVTWTICELPFRGDLPMIGASGGTTAVLILFAINFPHLTGLFMFVIPLPMWAIGAIVVAMDAIAAIDRTGKVAVTAHLGGAAFAALYYKLNWQLAGWLPTSGNLPKWRLRPGPKLRVHEPEETDDDSLDGDVVDDILRKIQEHGQDSLTKKERQILEQASREYQKRRH